MEWTKCGWCGTVASLGAYLFQSKNESFPEQPEERICPVCKQGSVDLFPSYDSLIAAGTTIPITTPGR